LIIGTGIAGTSAPNPEAQKMYPIYNALHRIPEGIKRKRFELGRIDYPILSAINIGIAGTSAPRRDAYKNNLIYSALQRARKGRIESTLG